MAIAFRPAGPDDLDPLLQGMAGLYGPSKFKPEPARQALVRLLAQPSRGSVVLIRSADQIAGYMVITLAHSLEFGGDFALLDELYVWPQCRGRGLGKAALQYAKDFCRQRGLAALRLEVQRDNQAALSLYEKAGFRGHNRDILTCWLSNGPPPAAR